MSEFGPGAINSPQFGVPGFRGYVAVSAENGSRHGSRIVEARQGDGFRGWRFRV